MLGAIIGDTVGSVYEFSNIKTTDFPLFSEGSSFTDDSVMTVAVADWLLHDATRSQQALEQAMVTWGHKYPNAGYGSNFSRWLFMPEFLVTFRDTTTVDGIPSGTRKPYNSFGNGSAMRASACGWLAQSLEDALNLGRRSAIITHNHPEGIKGAQAVAVAVYMARTGATKEEMHAYLERTFGYDLSHDCDDIRPGYRFDVSCQGTMPAALAAFFDSYDFESAIRLAVSLGGDSDTIACITGGIAEAFYHDIPTCMVEKMHQLLPQEFWEIIDLLYPSVPDVYMLNRFRVAQADMYAEAVEEMKQGYKSNHWMWYIFPQIDGLGYSDMSRQYAIRSENEARTYLQDPLLGARLRELTQIVCRHTDKTAQDIFGTIDAMKFRSCMTLFDYVEPNSVCADALRIFFASAPDPRTLQILQVRS